MQDPHPNLANDWGKWCQPAVGQLPEPTRAVAVATADDPVTHEENGRVPEGAAWTQHYFPSSDGSEVELYADVLLPEGLAEGEKVLVILSVRAYFGHSGGTKLENYEHTGPLNRFNDFIRGTDLFNRGYAFVMVDLRGFGGSRYRWATMTSRARPYRSPSCGYLRRVSRASG